MMKKTTYIMMSLAVSVFAAAGCAKQETNGLDNGDCPLMTIQPEVVSADGALKSNDGGATKATLINDATGLRSQGFGLSIYNGTTAYKSNVEMVYNNGAWAPKNGTMDWKWPAGTAYSFYAWSPSTLNVGTVTGTGVPAFTYSGITGQQDIMLGYYGGLGDNGAAPVRFSHALASIQFKTGTITGLGNITKIELSGVSTSGTCTPSYSGSSTVGFAWSSFSGNTALTQAGLTVATTASSTAIGTPFLVLPQSAAITVKLTDANSKTVTAAISAPALTVGKTAVYTINYDGQTASFKVSIEDWTNGQSGEVTIGEKPSLPEGALPGEFSVSATKKVHFSKGNLYWDGSTFNFEDNQYSFASSWDASHVNHFFWSKNGSITYAATYSDSGAKASDVLFTNDPDDEGKANQSFTVNGEKGVFRTLSQAEWAYLIGTRTVNGGTGKDKSYSLLNITYGGKMGIVLYPDNYTGEAISGTVGNLPEGVVFLPATGARLDSDVYGGGEGCVYWSSSTSDDSIYFVGFNSENVFTGNSGPRNNGFSIRLVTDSQ